MQLFGVQGGGNHFLGFYLQDFTLTQDMRLPALCILGSNSFNPPFLFKTGIATELPCFALPCCFHRGRIMT